LLVFPKNNLISLKKKKGEDEWRGENGLGKHIRATPSNICGVANK